MRNSRDNQYTVLKRAVGAITLFGIIIESIVGIMLFEIVVSKTVNDLKKDSAIKAVESMIDKLTMFVIYWPVGIVGLFAIAAIAVLLRKFIKIKE